MLVEGQFFHSTSKFQGCWKNGVDDGFLGWKNRNYITDLIAYYGTFFTRKGQACFLSDGKSWDRFAGIFKE